jgi:hypothetical protein
METDVKVPRFSKVAFWDVDYNSIDFEKSSLFVMEKVLNYGLWDDFIALIKYYGEARIRSEITATAYLSKEVMNFVCFYFRLHPDEFQCYKRRQLQNPLWDY